MKISRATLAHRCLRGHCPNCGHPEIFEGLRLQATCPVCFMALQRGSGWWLGPLVINYGLVVFLLVIPLIASGFLGVITLRWGVGLAVVSGLICPLFFYRWSWCLWLLAYYAVLPGELPTNNENLEWIDND